MAYNTTYFKEHLSNPNGYDYDNPYPYDTIVFRKDNNLIKTDKGFSMYMDEFNEKVTVVTSTNIIRLKKDYFLTMLKEVKQWVIKH